CTERPFPCVLSIGYGTMFVSRGWKSCRNNLGRTAKKRSKACADHEIHDIHPLTSVDRTRDRSAGTIAATDDAGYDKDLSKPGKCAEGTRSGFPVGSFEREIERTAAGIAAIEEPERA